jgi:hypothetical protein
MIYWTDPIIYNDVVSFEVSHIKSTSASIFAPLIPSQFCMSPANSSIS